MCAIEQGKAFFRFENDRGDTCAVEGFATGQSLAAIVGPALAYDHMREMRKRRKVARSADRALRRNDRMHSGVEHLGECLDHARAHAAEALGKRVGA